MSGLTSLAFLAALIAPAGRVGAATRGLTGGLGLAVDELAVAFGFVGGGLGTRGLTGLTGFFAVPAATGLDEPDAALGFAGGFGGMARVTVG